MAAIKLEPGDICEVEANAESQWNPESVDDLSVELIEELLNGNWVVRVVGATKAGVVNKNYLHFKS